MNKYLVRRGIRGEDHVKLDRIWLFEDVPFVSVNRVAQKPFHTNPLHKLTRAVHESWPAQKTVALSALLFDKLSRTVVGFSKLFDEESETGASIAARGRRIGDSRDWCMKASRKVRAKPNISKLFFSSFFIFCVN